LKFLLDGHGETDTQDHTKRVRFHLTLLIVLVAACSPDEGERCNPLHYSDNGIQGDCDTGLACVYPTAPSCGVAYCCRLDAAGNIIDPSPNCRPVPSLIAVCNLDMSASDAAPSD
jgi:hypothetical protein